jgi:hypothetical protein
MVDYITILKQKKMASKKKASKKDVYKYRLAFVETTKIFLEKELQEHDKTCDDSAVIESTLMSAIDYLKRAEEMTNILMQVKFKTTKQ